MHSRTRYVVLNVQVVVGFVCHVANLQHLLYIYPMARDYKKEYLRFQKDKSGYRAALNKKNRENGTYGNGDGKDLSHQPDGSTKSESESKNRGRREKSRKKGSKRRLFGLWDRRKKS